MSSTHDPEATAEESDVYTENPMSASDKDDKSVDVTAFQSDAGRNSSGPTMAFPEALFHQLLPAMVHKDHETRVGSHRIFSVVLVPSSVCPQSSSLVPAGTDPNKVVGHCQELAILLLSGFTRIIDVHQISLLLSSIWAQSISPENTPENYEAIAHTYSLVLLFSRAKHSGREALVRSFQLAFSLLDISLAEGGALPPSRRRSLYTLATTMIIVSGKAFSIVPLVPVAKATLTNKMVDPYLCLIEDCKLTVGPGSGNISFGSKEDDISAQKSLSEVKFSEEQSMESLAGTIVKHLESVSESELSIIKEQLLNRFVPDDDVCPIGSSSANAPKKNSENRKSMEEDTPLLFVDDDFDVDPFESSNRLSLATSESNDLLSVNQLLDSVLESAQHVGRMSISVTPEISYKEMTNQCEALVNGKREKMSNLMSIQRPASRSDNVHQNNTTFQSQAGHPFLEQNAPPAVNGQCRTSSCSREYQHIPQSFRLPASSPYDNFLKAARS
ncbi:protein SEMI-ROLLED LEAF 2-like [Bidens hawaiensis]|uniref:protein SEMI-ROLLED LEAF 2-like n=1 Tax=Bidens hawaiensis TaxID=980011 RepID=UPI004049C4D7